MSQNWLVAIDDSIWSYYAFYYAKEMMRPGDKVFMMHVPEHSSKVFSGFSSAALIADLISVSDVRARKILSYFGHKANETGIKDCILLKSNDGSPGPTLCKAVELFGIDQLIVGRRNLGTLKRLFVGSTSKYCVEYAECCVVVVKKPMGPELPEQDTEEEHIKDVGLADHEKLHLVKLTLAETTPDLADLFKAYTVSCELPPVPVEKQKE